MLFHTTAAHMEEIISESYKKTILLDFYASWCAPCRALAPILDDLSDRFENALSAYSVNVDTDGALAERYGVTLLPTVLVLVNGEIIGRYEKEITAEMLAEILP